MVYDNLTFPSGKTDDHIYVYENVDLDLSASVESTKMTIACFYDSKLILPPNLQRLDVGNGFNCIIDLPVTLVHFAAGDIFNMPLVVPDSLTNLELGHKFDSELTISEDSKLEYINIGNSFNRKFVMPAGLTGLLIGDALTEPLAPLPATLKTLILGNSYDDDMPALLANVPNLTTLKVTASNDYTIESFPPQLKSLTFVTGYVKCSNIHTLEDTLMSYNRTSKVKMPLDFSALPLEELHYTGTTSIIIGESVEILSVRNIEYGPSVLFQSVTVDLNTTQLSQLTLHDAKLHDPLLGPRLRTMIKMRNVDTNIDDSGNIVLSLTHFDGTELPKYVTLNPETLVESRNYQLPEGAYPALTLLETLSISGIIAPNLQTLTYLKNNNWRLVQPEYGVGDFPLLESISIPDSDQKSPTLSVASYPALTELHIGSWYPHHLDISNNKLLKHIEIGKKCAPLLIRHTTHLETLIVGEDSDIRGFELNKIPTLKHVDICNSSYAPITDTMPNLNYFKLTGILDIYGGIPLIKALLASPKLETLILDSSCGFDTDAVCTSKSLKHITIGKYTGISAKYRNIIKLDIPTLQTIYSNTQEFNITKCKNVTSTNQACTSNKLKTYTTNIANIVYRVNNINTVNDVTSITDLTVYVRGKDLYTHVLNLSKYRGLRIATIYANNIGFIKLASSNSVSILFKPITDMEESETIDEGEEFENELYGDTITKIEPERKIVTPLVLTTPEAASDVDIETAMNNMYEHKKSIEKKICDRRKNPEVFTPDEYDMLVVDSISETAYSPMVEQAEHKRNISSPFRELDDLMADIY